MSTSLLKKRPHPTAECSSLEEEEEGESSSNNSDGTTNDEFASGSTRYGSFKKKRPRVHHQQQALGCRNNNTNADGFPREVTSGLSSSETSTLMMESGSNSSMTGGGSGGGRGGETTSNNSGSGQEDYSMSSSSSASFNNNHHHHHHQNRNNNPLPKKKAHLAPHDHRRGDSSNKSWPIPPSRPSNLASLAAAASLKGNEGENMNTKMNKSSSRQPKLGPETIFVVNFMQALRNTTTHHRKVMTEEERLAAFRKKKEVLERKRVVNRRSARRKRIREKDMVDELSKQVGELTTINNALKADTSEVLKLLAMVRGVQVAELTQKCLASGTSNNASITMNSKNVGCVSVAANNQKDTLTLQKLQQELAQVEATRQALLETPAWSRQQQLLQQQGQQQMLPVASGQQCASAPVVVRQPSSSAGVTLGSVLPQQQQQHQQQQHALPNNTTCQLAVGATTNQQLHQPSPQAQVQVQAAPLLAFLKDTGIPQQAGNNFQQLSQLQQHQANPTATTAPSTTIPSTTGMLLPHHKGQTVVPPAVAVPRGQQNQQCQTVGPTPATAEPVQVLLSLLSPNGGNPSGSSPQQCSNPDPSLPQAVYALIGEEVVSLLSTSSVNSTTAATSATGVAGSSSQQHPLLTHLLSRVCTKIMSHKTTE